MRVANGTKEGDEDKEVRECGEPEAHEPDVTSAGSNVVARALHKGMQDKKSEQG